MLEYSVRYRFFISQFKLYKMTITEQKTIDNLLKVVSDLRSENSKFREDVKILVESINTKTEKNIFL